MTFSSSNSLMNEIHDYNTGLLYTFDKKTGNCLISNISGSSIDSYKNGSILYIRNPSQIFDFEQSNAQFVGLVNNIDLIYLID